MGPNAAQSHQLSSEGDKELQVDIHLFTLGSGASRVPSIVSGNAKN
jgi:hypothetical protein